MINVEPTYLRYVHDNLQKGSLSADNAANLPYGFTGIFEERFGANVSVKVKQEQLEIFTCFALLKKEVSVNFVAQILGVEEQLIIDIIATHASWFNSPKAGLYKLYHERIRVFFLQKQTRVLINYLNERIISKLEEAIQNKKEDELEYYALEFLSEHLLIAAFEDENCCKKLLAFAKSEDVWDRQIKISNKFDWSKKGLHQAALWTSKYNQKENISCYLDLVKLHNKEQNDAEGILQLIADNKIELALDRITAFGGSSKEEKERQFIIYILCLVEITIIKPKSNKWKKNVIKELLNHLDINIPSDITLFDWQNIIPSNLIFKIATHCNSKELDVLYKKVFPNIYMWSWIKDCGPYSNNELGLIAKLISHEYEDDILILANELLKNGLPSKALKLKRKIKNKEKSDELINHIALWLFENNRANEGLSISKKRHSDLTIEQFGLGSISLAKYYFNNSQFDHSESEIDDLFENIDEVKSIDIQEWKKLLVIFSEKLKQLGFIKESKKFLFAAIGQMKSQSQSKFEDYLMKKASMLLIEFNDFKKASILSKKIHGKHYRIDVQIKLATKLYENNKTNRAIEILNEAYNSLTDLGGIYRIAYTERMVKAFAEIGQWEFALKLIDEIPELISKGKCFVNISVILLNKNLSELGEEMFFRFLNLAKYNPSIVSPNVIEVYTQHRLFGFVKTILLQQVQKQLYFSNQSSIQKLLKSLFPFGSQYVVKQKIVNHLFITANKTFGKMEKELILLAIENKFYKLAIQKILEFQKDDILELIRFAFKHALKNKDLQICFFILKKILGLIKRASSEEKRIELIIAYIDFSFALNQLEDCPYNINNVKHDFEHLNDSLSKYFLASKVGLLLIKFDSLEKTIETIFSWFDDSDANAVLSKIGQELAQQGELKKAYIILNKMNDQDERKSLLLKIGLKHATDNNVIEATKIISNIDKEDRGWFAESTSYANKIYVEIALTLFKNNAIKDVLKYADLIDETSARINLWELIGNEFIQNKKSNLTLDLIELLKLIKIESDRKFLIKGIADKIDVETIQKINFKFLLTVAADYFDLVDIILTKKHFYDKYNKTKNKAKFLDEITKIKGDIHKN